MPPMYMDASAFTRRIGEPGGNSLGPGVRWILSRTSSMSGPATFLRISRARRTRTAARDGGRIMAPFSGNHLSRCARLVS